MASSPTTQSALGKRKKRDDPDEEYDHGIFLSGDEVDEEYDLTDDASDNEQNEDGFDFDFDFGDGIDDLDRDPNANYHERKEPFPTHPAFDAELPELAENIVSIVKGMVEIIEANPCKTEHVQSHLSKAQEMLNIPKPKPVKIALLGDTGAGKSSLLNSIIDIPGLAKAMGSGESCTCVATEHCAAFPGQQKTFAAKVEYFDMETVRDVLSEHVEAYIVYNNQSHNFGNDELRLQQKRRADTALKIFCAVFCKQKQYKSEAAAMRHLNEEELDLDKKVSEMCKWTTELLGSDEKDAHGSYRYREADTRRAFYEEIQPLLSSEDEHDEPSLWPFVKLVRIGVKGSRVLDNVTIADLPGISDTNQVKVNACLDHLRNCDCLWIVTPIARAIDNSTVDALVARFQERFKHKMAIICTRSDDDITKSLVPELVTRKNKMDEFKGHIKKAKDSQLQITDLRNKIRVRMKAHDTDMRAEKVKALRAKLDTYIEKNRSAHEDAWLAIVAARNAKVTQGVQKSLAGHLDEEHVLKVFCVSNEHYRSFKFGDKTSKFQLSPDKTGIPALRGYALSLAAPAKLKILEDFIKFNVTVLIKGLSLWTIRHYVEGADKLLAIVEQPREEVFTGLENYRNELIRTAKDELEDQIVSRADKWTVQALKVFKDKRGKNHWATNRAFMKKDGKYQTSTCPKESWNEQFSKSAISFINKNWGRVNTAQAEAMLRAHEKLNESVSLMQKTLLEEEAVQSLEMESFTAMIHGQMVGIDSAFRDHQKDYTLEMKNLKLDATQDRHTGFFTQAMQAGYENAKSGSGIGSVQRSYDSFIEHLSREDKKSPFVVMGDLITGAISYNAVTHCKALERQLINILKDIYNYFDGMIDTEEDDPQEKPVRAALKEYFKTAVPRFEEMKKDFEKIKQRSAQVEVKEEPKDN